MATLNPDLNETQPSVEDLASNPSIPLTKDWFTFSRPGLLVGDDGKFTVSPLQGSTVDFWTAIVSPGADPDMFSVRIPHDYPNLWITFTMH